MAEFLVKLYADLPFCLISGFWKNAMQYSTKNSWIKQLPEKLQFFFSACFRQWCKSFLFLFGKEISSKWNKWAGGCLKIRFFKVVWKLATLTLLRKCFFLSIKARDWLDDAIYARVSWVYCSLLLCSFQ